MNENDQDRMKKLLQQALPRVGGETELERDLWPAMLRRLDQRPEAPPWFDWALLVGLVGFAAALPASVPVLLYYL
ncbi:MAG: hypothetical protein ABSD67_17815 [Terracidiphilus sp.]|jgi:hypothetical protein